MFFTRFRGGQKSELRQTTDVKNERYRRTGHAVRRHVKRTVGPRQRHVKSYVRPGRHVKSYARPRRHIKSYARPRHAAGQKCGHHRLDADQTRSERHPRGTTGVLLHRVPHAPAVGHAEPEPAEGVLGQPSVGRRHVRRTFGQIQDEHQLAAEPRRGGHTAAGGRHAPVAADRPERRAVRPSSICRVLERPAPEARAVHAGAIGQRNGSRRGPLGLRLLVPRAPHGGGGPCRSGAHVSSRRPDGDVQRAVQLRRRRHRRKYQQYT